MEQKNPAQTPGLVKPPAKTFMETPGSLGNPLCLPKKNLSMLRRGPALGSPSKFPMVNDVSFKNESAFAQDICSMYGGIEASVHGSVSGYVKELSTNLTKLKRFRQP